MIFDLTFDVSSHIGFSKFCLIYLILLPYWVFQLSKILARVNGKEFRQMSLTFDL